MVVRARRLARFDCELLGTWMLVLAPRLTCVFVFAGRLDTWVFNHGDARLDVQNRSHAAAWRCFDAPARFGVRLDSCIDT